jgi:hypothetical protein
MSSRSTKEVFHDLRDTMQVPRISSRLKNKEALQTSRRSVSSKESRAPKIVRLSPSLEKSKLTKLRTPKKGKCKDYNNAKDSNSNSTSKMSFCGSPDLSVGFENLFKLTKLNEDTRRLIVSMNICNNRNMIHIPHQVFHTSPVCFPVKN